VPGVGAEVGHVGRADFIHAQRVVQQQPDQRRGAQGLRPVVVAAAATRARACSRVKPMVAV
jgi:hypothetical protein